MDFIWTDEQDDLRRVLRRFLEARAPEASVRASMATTDGFDAALWRNMADELGLQGVIVPAEHGGSGLSAKDLAVVMEELGRAVTCAPFLSTAVLTVSLLLAAGDGEASARLLPGIAAGTSVATVAFEDDRAAAPGVRAARSGGIHRLSGARGYVLDGVRADVVLVLADTDGGPTFFEVAGEADGLGREPLHTMDQTRKQARLTFDGTPGRVVGTPGQAGEVLASTLDSAVVALASEQVGGAERCIELAAEYAKIRVQFDRPIGSFQAVKHKLAAAAVQIELARTVAMNAASRVAEESADVPTSASVAKAVCSDAFLQAAKDSIQVHGGIGYTWEHPAHLYLKRAKADQVLFGDVPAHRRRVADLVGL